jgi:hypothetical protein
LGRPDVEAQLSLDQRGHFVFLEAKNECEAEQNELG